MGHKNRTGALPDTEEFDRKFSPGNRLSFQVVKSPDHFRLRDLHDALKSHGRYNDSAKLAEIDRQISALKLQRRELANDLLREIIYAYRDGEKRFAFRPCHLRRLDDLTVSDD